MKSQATQKNDVRFAKLLKEARDLIIRFKEHDPKPWPPEAKGLDLAAHVGAIEQALLEKQGYKSTKKSAEKLGEELATLFFISLDIAQDFGIDFETAFDRFLKETKKHLTY